ncbi:MAG: hypothetical protein O8C58_06095 [Candidatus Methanoperedens sp.]|nr:hypothetical protein [Candidatus Methanoperedens sp.]
MSGIHDINMKKIYIIIIVAVVLVVSFFYLSDSRKSIFTERLGDMFLTKYEVGEVAAQEISKIYGLEDISLAKGYTAMYNGKNGTMRIWVVEASDHNAANDAFNAMNSMLGSPGGHAAHEYSGDVGSGSEARERAKSSAINQSAEPSAPEKVDFMEITKPDVFMMKEAGRYNYYYLKMDYKMGRVFWITFDFPDIGYQKAMVLQTILKI